MTANTPRFRLNMADAAISHAAVLYAMTKLAERWHANGFTGSQVADMSLDVKAETDNLLSKLSKQKKKIYLNNGQVAITMAALDIAFKEITMEGDAVRNKTNVLIGRCYDWLAERKGRR